MTEITANIEGPPIDNSFIVSFMSYLLDLFLNGYIKGVSMEDNIIHIEYNLKRSKKK